VGSEGKMIAGQDSSTVPLLVDIGNTRVKWGLGKGGRIEAGEPFSSDPAVLGSHLDRCWSAMGRPDSVWVSNVAGAETADRLANWVAAAWGLSVRFVKPEAQGCGIRNGYEQPEKLGVDRWVSLIALGNRHPLPACAVGCGTALTLDVLDAGGRHLGGLIAPGLNLMKRALLRETHGIREIEGGIPALLGRTTAAGVEGGSLYACTGLIEKVVREASERLDAELHLVLSGGDAETLAAHLGIPCRVAPHLVLEGLLIMGNCT
jgi:type III pantothenate kinase